MTVLHDFRMRQLNGDPEETRQRAEGVLVALKRCTLDVAAGEITRASHRHHLDSNRVARALVRLAQNIEPEADSNATAVARFEWGALMPHRR
ncbi:antitermination regulator [Mycobacterium sp. NBC_00419]|uniref:antitermination regulator n=1 Tax=Mycobacterium sp. NBC_00419 TaxID=2975989 RepID=UPI002E1A1646